MLRMVGVKGESQGVELMWLVGLGLVGLVGGVGGGEKGMKSSWWVWRFWGRRTLSPSWLE